MNWSLYAIDGRKKLASFRDLLDYGDAFDAITVHEGDANRTTFVNLRDGSRHQAPGDDGNTEYHFVRHRKNIVVTQRREGHRYVGVLDQIPDTLPRPTTRDPFPIEGDVLYDADLDRYLVSGGDCHAATLAADGSEIECFARGTDDVVGRDLSTANSWFIATNSGSDPFFAVDLRSGNEVHPARDRCAHPRVLGMSPERSAPRVAIGCTNPSGFFLNLSVWTPQRELAVPGGRFQAGPVRGELVQLGDLSGETKPGSPTEPRWLDLQNLVLWKVPRGLGLAGRDLATNWLPEARKKTKVFLVDPRKSRLRQLGEVDCGRHYLKLAHAQDDVVTAICTTPGLRKSEQCRVGVDHTVIWDLRGHTRIVSKYQYTGATRDQLVFANASTLGKPAAACPPTRWFTVDRK